MFPSISIVQDVEYLHVVIAHVLGVLLEECKLLEVEENLIALLSPNVVSAIAVQGVLNIP